MRLFFQDFKPNIQKKAFMRAINCLLSHHEFLRVFQKSFFQQIKDIFSLSDLLDSLLNITIETELALVFISMYLQLLMNSKCDNLEKNNIEKKVRFFRNFFEILFYPELNV